MRQAFAIPAFRRLFVALAATMVADSVLLLTFGIWVNELTGSAGAAGLTLFWAVAPSVLAPLLGWVVDQFPRRRFLLLGYPLAAASLLPLALVHGSGRLWLVYAVAFAYGIALVMLPGAVTGLLKLIVPEQTLVHANASTSSFREGMRLFGPLGGATLFAAFGMDAVVLLALIAYAVAIVAVLTLRVDGDTVAPPQMHWRREFVAGFVHLRRDAVLWYPILALAGAVFAFGFIESLVYAVVAAFDRPPTFVAVIVTVQGVGALAGGLTSSAVITRIGHVRAIVLGLALFAVSTLVMALAPTMLIVLIGVIPIGYGLPLVVVAINTLIQLRTPNRLMARVSTTSDALVGVPQTVAIAVGAGLVALVPWRILLGGMTVAFALLTVALGTWSHRRAPVTSTPAEASPMGREASLPGRETSPVGREASPPGFEASPAGFEASPAGREESPAD